MVEGLATGLDLEMGASCRRVHLVAQLDRSAEVMWSRLRSSCSGVVPAKFARIGVEVSTE